jgi:ubiquinone/menaquinone biosynthesis C-methylase UbiE
MTTKPGSTPPVCSYEGSDYQSQFWDNANRRYEDAVETVAIDRLFNQGGHLLLELGAGAGRLTRRYQNWERIVLLDYSRTQLQQARERLGDSDNFIYVAADIYKLPFVNGLFDGATMIRTLHHMADAPQTLQSVRRVMAEDSQFLLEFANKRNLKSIFRWLLKKQSWSPFSPEQVEFVELNYNFHPKTIIETLQKSGFENKKNLGVSIFRSNWFKNHIEHERLVKWDARFQNKEPFKGLTPSIFTLNRTTGPSEQPVQGSFFSCPICSHPLPEEKATQVCPGCSHEWQYSQGIYEFRINPEQ